MSATTAERIPAPEWGRRAYKKIDGKGYVRVHNVLGRSHWEYEHRLVMERELRRYLTSNESIHHRNEIKHDNRPENLELLTTGEHVAHHNRKTPKRRRFAVVA